MTERRQRRLKQTPDGFNVRNIHVKPNTLYRFVPPGGEKALSAEEARERREAALREARAFFKVHAEDFAYAVGGEIDDRERIPSEGLRAVTLGLEGAGLGPADAEREIVRSLRERPFGDQNPTYSRDIARAFGEELTRDLVGLNKDREDAAALKPPTGASKA